jgi:Cof subfamily protein (haloacid dehalogenase superfamily)
MNIKMIVTDLDNTLIRSDGTISEYTVSTLKKCQKKGIIMVFATARSTQAASRFLDIFMPNVFIGYGGALSIAGGDVISRFDIPADISYQLINDCLCEPEIKYVLAINETVAFTNRIDVSDLYASHYKLTDFTIKNNLSYLKISSRSDNPEAVGCIAKKYPMCDMLRYKGEDIYRFANRNAIKWYAVKEAADYYGIDINFISAFGDDVNDLEMIENCGIGVAVANAIDEVKAVADCICNTNDNDGVAKWLEENVL